jgi:hypothetical protein
LLWDESADSLIVTGTTTLVGTTNLDVVDIDGAVQIDATLSVGVDDTGYDVKFFGATAGAYMLWDESADDLILGGAAGLSVNSTALVTGVLTTTAATVHTGGITMPDNAKAIFGDSSDLEIYHDGTQSFISEQGPSSLNILSSQVALNNPANTENMLTAVESGAVTLFHNNAAKLATTATGIDVTGTVVADGLTVDGDTVTANAQNAVTVEFNNATGIISADRTGGNYAGLSLRTTEGSTPLERLAVAYNGDISFYEATGTTPKFFWDASAEALGIGTSSPSTTLDLVGNWVSNTGQLSIDTPSGETYSGLAILNNGTPKGFLYHDNSAGTLDLQTFTTDALRFKTNNAERMQIDSSGNVGIGASSPAALLHVAKSADGGVAEIILENSFTNAGSSTDEITQIQGRFGNYDASYIITGKESDFTTAALRKSYLAFSTRTATTGMTEKVRIDSSGNVGIGNSLPLGRLTISNAAGTNAPSTVTAANTYLQLGSDDYGPSNNGKFMIGFGFTDATNTNSPAYIGYEEATTSGDTYGDLTFYTRSVVTDTAPTERMRIDSTGAVTMPYQPAFSVNNAPTTQANIAINTVVTITWAGERFDQNADFDLGANSFTAPVTGKYQFNLVIRLQDVDIDADYYIISIVTSNVEYKYIFDPVFASDPAYFTVNLSVLADLDASDTAYTTIYQGGGAAQTDITGDATYTYFTGYLVA